VGWQPELFDAGQKRLEFRVCQVQQARVTFVNGEWAGAVAMDPSRAEAALASCPQEWDYLDQAGRDGWDLAAVIPGAAPDVRMVYLRRER